MEFLLPQTTSSQKLDNVQIVVPNSLQMGLTESPPFFCAATQTAQDVIRQLLNTLLPPHPSKDKMLPAKFSKDMQGTANLGHIINLIEVFVDDFIGCTDNTTKQHLKKNS